VTIYLHCDADRVVRATFEGSGCAICMASASLLTEHLAGLGVAAAGAAVTGFLHSFAAPDSPTPAGALAALAAVRTYPSRVRCATLPWQTAQAALAGPTTGAKGPVPTEKDGPHGHG
jgi:nitrogen fixation protein NifU and related proteins